ncbi:hypothetical protein PuT2_00040 [Pusillimonas sp. T2]|uniref:SH3 domain-containing protein n=1 Tax=Pusillimonas sp. T2 TaxID=1548123 RepID=UPI000B946537|nr:SH3 domain-containing protein [Pusillimonas sp. T2]OXR50311.1 hypothetical protein PuT2_00040 [Pusillimonas sp. T2]
MLAASYYHRICGLVGPLNNCQNFGDNHRAMKDIFDNPTLLALRALDESPTMKAIRAFEDSPVARLMRDLDNSPAIRIMRDLENSPAMKAIRGIEESPVMRMLRDFDDSPTLKAIREIEGSPAFMAIRSLQESPAIKAIQALERSPILEAFSTVATRITHGYGALAFSEAYGLLIEEYEEQVADHAAEPLDSLAESVKDRAAQAPFAPLSAEFYLGLVFALFLFYLSQISAEQSEERLLSRIDGMEQTISIQLDALKQDIQGRVYLVADRAVNLRTGPGSDHNAFGMLLRNQKVVQIGGSGVWVNVEYFDYVANELKRGWAHSRYFIAVSSENG